MTTIRSNADSPPLRTSRLLLGLAVWLGVALVIGAQGALGRLHPPGPQLVILALTLSVLGSTRFVPSLRAWVARADWRTLVVVHVFRLVAGINFLVLARRGVVDRAFMQAGVGDVLVAVLAIGLIAFVRPTRPGARPLYLAWNVLGLTDILLVLVTAVRLGLRDPEATAAFGYLPLALLPLFVVPLIVSTHVLLFRRLLAAGDGAATTRVEGGMRTV